MTPDRFTARAGRLAGLAGTILGWSPDVFWRATPTELAAVLTALVGETGAVAPPDARLLKTLQERFPDGPDAHG